jgi:hypothetical protein
VLLLSTVLTLLITVGVATVEAENLLEYNASGTFIKVPQLNNINITHVHLMTYFVGRGNLTVSVLPLTPTTCNFSLKVNYPNGTLITYVNGSAQPFMNYTTAVVIDLANYDYVVIEGDLCNLTVPPYAVRYFPTYVTPPPDPILQLFWSIACYSPAIAVFLRSNPRTGGVVMLASLPLVVPIMYTLGADPTIIPIFTSFIVIISLLMIAVK